eukprot:CAMPEP_0173131314 /NCGR_PEP_ID=MMETSP1102-20130122/60561_1 /TAXON_ID=49646 /ORGANISM="Geminigera sp., Strain Caron Lab Isolate" /LENGTH=164 /DNA_ID=CAMNT_0014042595 /DNA_START=350 /DNA_END=842 /DNA_ORIENTATION=-
MQCIDPCVGNRCVQPQPPRSQNRQAPSNKTSGIIRSESHNIRHQFYTPRVHQVELKLAYKIQHRASTASFSSRNPNTSTNRIQERELAGCVHKPPLLPVPIPVSIPVAFSGAGVSAQDEEKDEEKDEEEEPSFKEKEAPMQDSAHNSARLSIRVSVVSKYPRAE